VTKWSLNSHPERQVKGEKNLQKGKFVYHYSSNMIVSQALLILSNIEFVNATLRTEERRFLQRCTI
jgi:hypothetical protein